MQANSFASVLIASALLLSMGCDKKPEAAASVEGGATQAASQNTTQATTPSNAGDQIAKLDKMPETKIDFRETSYNFGKIAEGEIVSHRFSFKNTGDKPLLVADVRPSCGCTTPDWTKTEVAPGQEGFIQVQFNSQGRPGEQHKSVTVFSNIKDRVMEIKFQGEVISAKK